MMVRTEPKRGDIYDRNMRIFATSLNMDSVYVNPKRIKDPQLTSRELSKILDMKEAEVLRRLTKDASFVWLKRKTSDDISKEITKLNPRAFGVIKEPKRVYPNGELGSHVLGFAGLDNVGLEGIELVYDEFLKGQPGFKITKRDAKLRELVFMQQNFVPAVEGHNIVLTIDEAIQHIVETELDRIYEDFSPKAATIIAMDPRNGQILALANRPTYDPNIFERSESESRRNRAITDMYEPGSVFKVITASAILDLDSIDPQEKIFCENGAYKIGRHTLHDHKPHGWLNFFEIIEVSSNIGTIKAAQHLGQKNLYNYIKTYGFGEKTGIDLPGEAIGMIRKPEDWSRLSMCAIPMGQEVAVTALQMVCAVSAIANRGVMVRPYMVDRIIDDKGGLIKSFKTFYVRRVLDRKTAIELTGILTGVVERGTGKNAKIEGYPVAGKTGTAQKVAKDGRYSHSKFISSFVGFAPADDPLISVIVIVDEPRPFYYASLVAAPAFGNVVKESIAYLESK